MLLNGIIINILIGILWLLLRVRWQAYQAVCEFFIIVLLPGAGVAFVAGSYILEFLNSGKDLPEMYQTNKNEQKLLRRMVKEEADIIPASDILMLDNTKTKRIVLGDIIKRDILYNREILFDAIRNEDSEVSHYAVSVVTNRLAKLENSLYAIRKKTQEKPQDLESLRQFADAMQSYLQISNLDKISQQKYEEEYANVLEKLIFLDGHSKRYFCELIDYHLDAGTFIKAEYLCELFQEKFPLSEEPYLQLIKLYYYLNNRDALLKTIVEFKQTNIKFTSKTLEIIRFWDGGLGSAL